jgi:hypothetical protein
MNLANALDIKPETARSIMDAYFPNKVMRYNREDENPLDKILLKRTASVIGFDATYRMLERDKLDIQIGELDAKQDQIASNIANIADKQQIFRQEVLELFKSAAAANAKESLGANHASTQNLVQSSVPPNWIRPPIISPNTVSAPSQGPIQVLPHSNRKAFNPTAPQMGVFQTPPPRAPPFASGDPQNTQSILGEFVFGQQ